MILRYKRIYGNKIGNVSNILANNPKTIDVGYVLTDSGSSVNRILEWYVIATLAGRFAMILLANINGLDINVLLSIN